MSEKEKASTSPANKNIDTKEHLVKKEKIEAAAPPITTTQKSTEKKKRNAKNDENVVKYCLCREPERPGMIGCDFCEEWYHSSCLNLKKEDVKQLTKCKWKCPKCELTDSKQAKALEKATDAISTTSSEEESKESSGRKTR